MKKKINVLIILDEHFTTQRGTYIMQATLIVSFVVAYVCQGIDFKHVSFYFCIFVLGVF
jgi:hypothetical protein